MKKSFLLFLVSFAAIFSISIPEALAGSVPMYHAPSMKIPEGLTKEETIQAIKISLVHYKWELQKAGPDSVIASVSSGSGRLVATIAVHYANGNVEIKHLDSKGFGYKKDGNGKELIHSRYNRWIKNIEKGLMEALEASAWMG